MTNSAARSRGCALAPTDGPTLLLHYGMTGGLRWSGRGGTTRHRHDRLILVTAEGEMRYRNMRMLGGAWLARNERELESVVGSLGPDAADLVARLRAHLADDLDTAGALAAVDAWAAQARTQRGCDATAPRLVRDAVDALLGVQL